MLTKINFSGYAYEFSPVRVPVVCNSDIKFKSGVLCGWAIQAELGERGKSAQRAHCPVNQSALNRETRCPLVQLLL
jgi:hypothetical protein